jgi:hypothetical protein
MIAKERGWVLSIDEASNVAGAALWYDGKLVASSPLRAKKSTDPITTRLRQIVAELNAFLEKHLKGDTVRQVVFEGVQSRMVMLTIGAFLTSPYIDARISPKASFVQSSSWKHWASKRGATGPVKDIKGVRSLREVGFDVDGYGITSDDVADSVFLMLVWREKP